MMKYGIEPVGYYIQDGVPHTSCFGGEPVVQVALPMKSHPFYSQDEDPGLVGTPIELGHGLVKRATEEIET